MITWTPVSNTRRLPVSNTRRLNFPNAFQKPKVTRQIFGRKLLRAHFIANIWEVITINKATSARLAAVSSGYKWKYPPDPLPNTLASVYSQLQSPHKASRFRVDFPAIFNAISGDSTTPALSLHRINHNCPVINTNKPVSYVLAFIDSSNHYKRNYIGICVWLGFI